jgi:transcriptional regulator with XRE-family HTH domain
MATVKRWSGREARLLRQALRLSVRNFAEDLGISPRTISKWEAAGVARCPRPELQAALDTALARATDHERARFQASLDSVQPADHDSLVDALPPPSRGTVTRDPAPMLLATPWFPRLKVDQLRALTRTLDEASHQAEVDLVTYFDRQLTTCQNQDGSRGPVHALPFALSIIAAIETSGRRVSLPVRRQLLCLAARGSEFVGWLYRDAGASEQATYWYDRAAEWAQEAGSPALQGYVLLRRSQMAFDTRDALRVLTLAQAAQGGPWQLPVRVRAEVAQQEALGMAMVGEPLAVVERQLDQAHGLLDQAVPDDEGSLLLGASFSDATLDLRSAACYTEAGLPSRAADTFATVIASGTLSHRDQSYFRARRAAALTLCGEVDEATEVALASVNVATATNSQRTLRVLGDVAELLEPWSTRPGVAALREAVGV